jgi:Zn-dependent peptidase ImmA (M78 family)
VGEYSPWRDAAARHPDVHIARVDLHPACGAWVASEGVILLSDRMDRAERNTTLAHEIAHIDLGHRSTGRRWFDQRQERDADRLAATRLVGLDELAVTLAWALCPEEVAAALEVTVAVVRRRIRALTDLEKAYISERLERAA